MEKIFKFQKPEYMWKNPIRCIDTRIKFQADILKIQVDILAFWRPKAAIFSRYFRRFLRFFIFKVCPSWAVQKVF